MESFAEQVDPLEPEHQPSSVGSLLRTAAVAQGQSARDIAEATGVDPAEVQRLFTDTRSADEERFDDDATIIQMHEGLSEARLRRLYTAMARKRSEYTPEERRAGVELSVKTVLEARARLRQTTL